MAVSRIVAKVVANVGRKRCQRGFQSLEYHGDVHYLIADQNPRARRHGLPDRREDLDAVLVGPVMVVLTVYLIKSYEISEAVPVLNVNVDG